MKKILSSVMIILSIFVLAGCQQSDSSHDGIQKIGYAAPGLGSEYNMMIFNELSSITAENGIDLITLSCEGDVALQVQQIENLVTMGVDVIITYPVDVSSVEDVLINARNQGIKVVVADADGMNPDSYDIRINADGFDMGYTATMMASDWIDATFPDAEDGTVEVAVLGFWFTEALGERCDVMADIETYNSKANVVAIYDIPYDQYAAHTAEYVEILLQNYPDVNVILSFTDTFALIANEIIMAKDFVDVSQIGQFTVDRSESGLYEIYLSQTDDSSIRGTAVPGMYAASDLFNAAMGNLDSELEDKVYNAEMAPIDADNIMDFEGTFFTVPE